MRVLILIALWLAAPFWETIPAEDWTMPQIQKMLTDSPWAGPTSEGLIAYLASAKPMQEAEEQQFKKRKRRVEDPDSLPQDYLDYRRESAGKVIILAISLHDLQGLSEVGESNRMEKDTVMIVGRKRIRIEGHFPPTPSDPYLRLIFPRETQPNQKTLRFEVYIPGHLNPFQEIEFDLRKMTYKGQTEF